MELREQVRAMHEAKAEELSRRTEGSCRCIRRAGSVSAASCRRIRQPRRSMQCSQSISTRLAGRWSSVRRSGGNGRRVREDHQEGDSIPEEVLALVRIRVSGSVYAYALDPKEVWRAWDCQKEQAAFLTRTLVKKNGQNALVKRRLQMMLREQTGEPELQLEQDFDPETGRFGHRKMLEFSK